MSIFPWQRMQHINVWSMVGETCLHRHSCGSLCVSDTMLRQSQGPRQFPKERAECIFSIVRHRNAEQGYHPCIIVRAILR